jgi:predicted nucleotidyltransferase
MASRLQMMNKKGLVHPPRWLPQNVHYEVITGSVSYGASNDSSDMDIVGVVIPPKEDIFPHLKGEIPGFGRQIKKFEQYQEHHINDNDTGKEYDFTFYSIVKFFNLAMENNPNIVDILFTPQQCVLFASQVGQIIRDNRKIFLHKGSYQKLRGYSYAQLHKIGTKSIPMPDNISEILSKIDKNDLKLIDQEKIRRVSEQQ